MLQRIAQYRNCLHSTSDTFVTQQAFLFPSLFYSVILQSVGVGMVCTVGGAVVGTVAAQQEIVIIANAGADSYLSLYVAPL